MIPTLDVGADIAAVRQQLDAHHGEHLNNLRGAGLLPLDHDLFSVLAPCEFVLLQLQVYAQLNAQADDQDVKAMVSKINRLMFVCVVD